MDTHPDRPEGSVWMTAKDAAASLGISLATLYSYVSRDLLHPVTATGPDGGRGKRYRSAEVERLARRHDAAREPRRVAGTALDFGLPVLQSSLSLIEHGRLYYRGQDAVLLAETACLEDIAALLWCCEAGTWRSATPPQGPGDEPPGSRTSPTPDGLLAAFHRRLGNASNAGLEGDAAAAAPWRLVQAMLAAATGQEGPLSDDAPLHQQLQRAWGLPESAADGLRRALVLCADHELNASSFTARCVASTGASLSAAVAAALGAMTGPRHGGMSAQVEIWWPQMERHGGNSKRLRDGLAGQPVLPGFGHTLYPQGDPRATCLLQSLPRDKRRERFLLAVHESTGRRPNIDFALVALRRAIGAPAGAALAVFAIARTVGWLAHAFEQRRSGQLIRPRADYVGPRPAAPKEAPSSGRIIRH